VADTITTGILDPRTGAGAMLLRRFGAGPWTRVNWQARPMEPPQDYYLRAVSLKPTRAGCAILQPIPRLVHLWSTAVTAPTSVTSAC
jgi:hypothetical protein